MTQGYDPNFNLYTEPWGETGNKLNSFFKIIFSLNAGENPPANAVQGMPWLDISDDWDNAVLKFYDGSSWVLIDEYSPYTKDLKLARGSKNTLWQFLQVAHNEDGSLKAEVAENLTEWVDSGMEVTYVTNDEFSVLGDQTDIFIYNRKIRATLDSSFVYAAIEESAYNSFNDITIVSLKNSILDDTVQKIEYGLVKPGNTGGMPVIEQETPEIVGDAFNDFIFSGVEPTQNDRTIDTTSGYAYFNSEKIDVPVSSTIFTIPTQFRHDILSLDSSGNLVKTEGTEGQSVKAFRVEESGIISKEYTDTPKELRDMVKVWNSGITGDISTGWRSIVVNESSNGYYLYTYTTDKTYYIGFVGTGLDLITRTSTNAGILGVSVDGGTEQTVDLYTIEDTYQVTFNLCSDLDFGYHEIKLRCTGNKNVNSSGVYVFIDAFDIYTPDFSTSVPTGHQPVASMLSIPEPSTMSTIPTRPDSNEKKGWARYEAEQYGEFFGSGWTENNNVFNSNTIRIESATTDDYCTFKFKGIGVRLITYITNNGGIAEISIDGVIDTTIDTYSSSVIEQAVGYEKISLSDEEHEIKIRVTGNKNSGSSGNIIRVDAFEVHKPIMLFEDTRITTPLIKKQDKLQYILIQDQKPSGVSGGTFTAGAWRTRDLNTIVQDDTGEVVLSNNQFTLPSGRYIITIKAPAYKVNHNALQLWNLTQQYGIPGVANFSNNTGNVANTAHLNAVVKFDSNNIFEVLHRCETTRSDNGFGVDNTSATSIYTTVEIIRLGDA